MHLTSYYIAYNNMVITIINFIIIIIYWITWIY